jgi:hypothetical protein
MTALLTAHAGRKARGQFAMTGGVVRVGSHPGCAVRLPELEPHAVTIERRGDRYVVHNRTQRELWLHDGPLAPGASGEWPDGARLHVRSDLTLSLNAGRAVAERPVAPADSPVAGREGAERPAFRRSRRAPWRAQARARGRSF